MISVREPSANPNHNCLEGKRCPECGSYGPFEVAISMRVLLLDSGTNDAEDGAVEFDDDSWTRCCACRHGGKFSDFSE